jgi:hypothetical protein
MNDKDRAVMDIYDAQHASLRHDLFLLRHIGRMPTQSIVVALGDSVDDPALISEEPAIREFFDLEAEVHLHNEDEGEVVA